MLALTSESVNMSDDSESNSSLIKQFQWVTKFRAGPSGYANNKTLAGPQWFLTEAEAISDAEKNAENHVKDYPNFQDYDGYYIDTKIVSSKNSDAFGSYNDDVTSEENVNDESAESDDSRGLVLDTDGDSVPVTLGKRKFKEDVSEDQDKKRKSDGISSSKSEDCSGDVIKPVKSTGPISIKLGVQRSKENASILQKASSSVAKAFNPDTDSEEEEMPPEAKMRMRNIGRDTPTSAGPNSFGKTRQGFCDTKKVWERKMKDKIREVADNN